MTAEPVTSRAYYQGSHGEGAMHEEAIEGRSPAEEPEGREPVLRVPEELTPLPDVDPALPLFGAFAEILGRRRARYKVAFLKTLQADGSGRWKIRRLQEVAHWLEPTSVTDLAGELRAAGVLAYDPVSGNYRLTSNARVVTAVLDALTVPGVEPRRLIRFLNKAMALAQAAGAGEEAVFGQFASAVAVLRSDWEELKALIDDRSQTALLEAAELVRAHVDDMRELLEEHDAFFASRRGETLFLGAEQEALDLIAKLGSLSAEVIAALTERAEDHLRGGLVIDRSDLREFVASAPVADVAALIDDLAAPSPYVAWISAEAAFAALEDAAAHERPVPPPLPQPGSPQREPPSESHDPAAELAGQLRALTAPATTAEVVVRDDWSTSVGRHSALVAAYARHGDLPSLEHTDELDEPRRDGVWRISRTAIRPDGVEPGHVGRQP